MSLSDIKYIEPNRVLDIGAWLGHWARDVNALWPDAEITCVEGNPDCEPALKATGFRYRIAMLSSEVGVRTYYMQPGTRFGTGNSLYRENTHFFENCNTMEVDTEPLANLFPGETFDLIKIDTQGSELDIIRGGLEICQRAKHILMEVAIVPYNEGAPLLPEVSEFMAKHCFIVETVVDDIVHPTQRNVVQKDILYRRL